MAFALAILMVGGTSLGTHVSRAAVDEPQSSSYFFGKMSSSGAVLPLRGSGIFAVVSSSGSTHAVSLRGVALQQRVKERLEKRKRLHAAAVDTIPESLLVNLDDVFPPFVAAVQPVSRVPNWGAMSTPEQWNRSYDELTSSDFVEVPAYDLTVLRTPIASLLHPFITTASIPIITAKLYYSTRFMGAYDIDADEFTAGHAGVDLKLALGTPIAAIGGGRVQTVENTGNLGLHVIIEHRIPSEGTFYSVYGHLGTVDVQPGDAVLPGQTIGTVGMTGKTTAPHLHLEVDIGHEEKIHKPYFPSYRPSNDEVLRWTVNPITFIQDHEVVRTVSNRQ